MKKKKICWPKNHLSLTLDKKIFMKVLLMLIIQFFLFQKNVLASMVFIEPTSNNYEFLYNANKKSDTGLVKIGYMPPHFWAYDFPEGLDVDINCTGKPVNLTDAMTGTFYMMSEISTCHFLIRNKSDKAINVNNLAITNIKWDYGGDNGEDIWFYLSGTIPPDVRCNISAPGVIDLGDISSVKFKKDNSYIASANIEFNCGESPAFLSLKANNVLYGGVTSGKGIIYRFKINDNNVLMDDSGFKIPVSNREFKLSVVPEANGKVEIGEHSAVINLYMSIN